MKMMKKGFLYDTDFGVWTWTKGTEFPGFSLQKLIIYEKKGFD